MKSKKTLIIGASTNPNRYAYMAANKLVQFGHEIVLVGIKKGEVAGVPIQNDLNVTPQIHTITLYVGPQNQEGYYNYILGSNPERVIFNPGTWNDELVGLLEKNQIEAVDACTLVMLSAGTY